MRVRNMVSDSGNSIANQFVITGDNGEVTFQSYNSIIVKKENGKITLGRDWDCSRTTSKYRNRFLREDTKTTERKIKDGTYIVDKSLQ